MPPPTPYDVIKSAIEDETTIPSWAIQAYYKTDTETDIEFRIFLAYILGKSHAHPGQRKSVLAYQYAGPHTSEDHSKKWRCFNVDSFTSLSRIPFDPPAGLTIPPPPTKEQVDRQNCVDIPGGRIVRKVIYKP